MPLHPGHSKAVLSQNVGEMLDAYKATGKIGNTTPRSMSHAKRIAVAAAYSNARRKKKS